MKQILNSDNTFKKINILARSKVFTSFFLLPSVSYVANTELNSRYTYAVFPIRPGMALS